MTTLITTYGIAPVVMILIVGIPSIINFINWCKTAWAERERFKKENIEKGKKLEREAEEKELRFIAIDERITSLENNLAILAKTVATQNDMIKRLSKSDMLDIKSWIKIQHERYTKQGYIDAQALDLLCQRHEIYKEEGGNSWADCLVEELKQLPHNAITTTELRNICANPLDRG